MNTSTFTAKSLLSNRILKFLLLISSIIIILGSISLVSATYSFFNIGHIKSYYLKVDHSVRQLQKISSSLSLKYYQITSDSVKHPLHLLEEINNSEQELMNQLNDLVNLLSSHDHNERLMPIIKNVLLLKEHIITSKDEYEKLSIALIEDDIKTVKKQGLLVNQVRSRFHQLVFNVALGITDQFSIHITKMNKVTILIFISTILIVSLSIMVTLFATNRLIKQSKNIILSPIDLFSKASQQLARGNFEGEINPEDAGDLHAFAEQFNDMQRKLSAYQYELKTFNTALDRVAALAILNANKQIVEFNSNFLKLNGLAEDMLTGAHFATLSCNQSDSFFELNDAMEREYSWQGELVYCGNNFERWADTVVVPVQSEKDKNILEKFIVISFDITEKKRAESELKNSEAQLQITNRLTALGELASGIAHEINNPLVIIRSTMSVLSKLFEKGRLDREQMDKYISDINKMVSRISSVTRSLKMLSQRDVNSELEKIEPEQIMEDVKSIFYTRIKDNFIDFKIVNNISHENTFYSNPTILAETLINLVTNALEAIQEQDNKWIEISADHKNGDFLFQVKDSGNGITEEVAEKIFNPLFTTKTIGSSIGAGMGLSMARKSIESIGGRLYYSASEENTTFVISIPQES